MKDINELVYNALRNICRTCFEEISDNPIPDEYIVFDRLHGYEFMHADNEATLNYHSYRVYFYCLTKRRREEVMRTIKQNMKDAGFKVLSDNIPVPRETGAKKYGAYSEFAYYEVL